MAFEEQCVPFLEGFRPEQKDAIRATESLVVVSAGAGTGKTQTLATRFAWLLATDPTCRVEQILTLTFTEKAAREMQERIRDRLKRWYRGNETTLPHLRDALERFDEGYVSTIHAFAYRVVRESGLVLDLDPGATLLAAPEEEAFWEEFVGALDEGNALWMGDGMTDAWPRRAEEFFASPEFADLRDGFGAAALATAVRETSELAASLGWTSEFLWNWSDAQILEDLGRLVDPCAEECWDLWQGRLLPGVETLLKKDTTVLGKALAELQQRFPPEDQERRAFLVSLFHVLDNLSGTGNVKKTLEDLLGERLVSWRDARKNLVELAQDLEGEDPEPPEEKTLRQGLRRLAALGWERWDQWRRRRGGLIFRDLIALAAEVLARDPEAGRRFRHLLVDEFQDTDPLQDALLKALWKPGESTLFLVGDLKQSIYRFRHADLNLFGAYIARAKSAEEREFSRRYLPLPCSFRLRSPLLAEVNALFGELWKEGLGRALPLPYESLTEPHDVPLWQERHRVGGAPVEVLLAKTSRRGRGEAESLHGTAAEGRSRCFGALAARFREIHDLATENPSEAAKGTDRVWDKDLGQCRDPRWNDFAVLVPTRSHNPLLEKAFAAAGIPAAFDSSQSYFSRGEVRDVVTLLKALVRPEDDLALAGWCASPFSGTLPRDALSWLAATESLRAQMGRRAPAAARRFDRLRRTAQLQGASAALALLLEDPCALRTFEGSARRRVAANLRAAEAMAREYETTLGGGLAACADYLDRALRKERPKEEPNFVGEDEDAVRVLTIHGAKGLEYPFVAVTGLERSFRGGRIVGPTASRHLAVVYPRRPEVLGSAEEKPPTSVNSRWHRLLEAQDLEEEGWRLFYVASTRAREKLFLCGNVSVNKNEEITAPPEHVWLGPVYRHYGGSEALRILSRQDEKAPEVRQTPPERPKAPENALPLPRGEAALGRLGASAYALLRYCPRGYRRSYRQGIPLVWDKKDDGPGGNLLGSLAHEVLRGWRFPGGDLEAWLPEDEGERERVARRLPPDLRIPLGSAPDRRALRTWLQAFGQSAEAQRLGTKELRKEVVFRLPLDSQGSEQTLDLRGSLDLFWEDEDGLHVRDYKTTPQGGVPDEIYRHQLLFYGVVVRRCHPGRPVDLALYHLRAFAGEPGEPVTPVTPGSPEEWNSWDDIQREEAWCREEEAILAAARHAAQGPWPLRPEGCHRCPWKNSCAPENPEQQI